MSATTSAPLHAPQQATRIGSVSYLNAKPLIYGLAEADDVQLTLDIPSKLLQGLRDRRFDVALLPIIDYQRLPNLRLLSAGGIGSDGTTYTVRIFSKVPIEQIRRLAVDTHSHTSVALARVILAESFQITPDFVDLHHRSGEAAESAEARLLIGDKVVTDAPPGFPHQLDLGEAWKRLTGLPFVFAAWVARQGVDLGDLPDRLAAAKRDGLAHVDQIVQQYAGPHGWPPELARRYLTQYLKFDLGPRQITAITRFHALAARHGLIPSPPRELIVHP